MLDTACAGQRADLPASFGDDAADQKTWFDERKNFGGGGNIGTAPAALLVVARGTKMRHARIVSGDAIPTLKECKGGCIRENRNARTWHLERSPHRVPTVWLVSVCHHAHYMCCPTKRSRTTVTSLVAA